MTNKINKRHIEIIKKAMKGSYFSSDLKLELNDDATYLAIVDTFSNDTIANCLIGEAEGHAKNSTEALSHLMQGLITYSTYFSRLEFLDKEEKRNNER